ncbi:MAG: hypothetical protein U1E65_25025 [Myxococcota bacterium]
MTGLEADLYRRRAAETELLAHDPRAAWATVERIGNEDPRTIRLALDAAVEMQDAKRALPLLEKLAQAPGWRAHAERQRWELTRTDDRRDLARLGGAMFAFALTVLLVGGGGALIRPTRTSMVLVGVLVADAAFSVWVSPLLGRLLALIFLAWAVLGHAAASAIRRTAAPRRMRVFVVVLLGLGMVGVSLAILAPIPWSFVLSALSLPR